MWTAGIALVLVATLASVAGCVTIAPTGSSGTPIAPPAGTPSESDPVQSTAKASPPASVSPTAQPTPTIPTASPTPAPSATAAPSPDSTPGPTATPDETPAASPSPANTRVALPGPGYAITIPNAWQSVAADGLRIKSLRRSNPELASWVTSSSKSGGQIDFYAVETNADGVILDGLITGHSPLNGVSRRVLKAFAVRQIRQLPSRSGPVQATTFDVSAGSCVRTSTRITQAATPRSAGKLYVDWYFIDTGSVVYILAFVAVKPSESLHTAIASSLEILSQDATGSLESDGS
jgi:hypothetical protein